MTIKEGNEKLCWKQMDSFNVVFQFNELLKYQSVPNTNNIYIYDFYLISVSLIMKVNVQFN